MGFWQTLFASFGGITAVVLVIGFFAKAIVKQLLQRDLDRYKAELQVAAEKRSTQYQIMQTKVAEVMAGTYARLYCFVRASQNYTRELEYEEPSKQDKYKEFADAYNDLRSYFYPNRLFFTESVGDGINELICKLRSIANRFTLLLRSPEQEHLRQNDDDSWHKLDEEMEKEAQPLLDEIRHHFQDILGVNQDTTGGRESVRAEDVSG